MQSDLKTPKPNAQQVKSLEDYEERRKQSAILFAKLEKQKLETEKKIAEMNAAFHKQNLEIEKRNREVEAALRQSERQHRSEYRSRTMTFLDQMKATAAENKYVKPADENDEKAE